MEGLGIRQIICPFFQTACLREDCAAYQPEETREEYIFKNPYCHALKRDLPQGRFWDEPKK